MLAVGGRVRPRSLACVDDWALDALSKLRVTVAFLGTNGLSVENGLTTPDPAEATVKRATLSIAQHTVLLADHSKVGEVSLLRYGELDQFALAPGEISQTARPSLFYRLESHKYRACSYVCRERGG